MFHLNSFLVAALLFATVLAAPTQPKKRSFKIERVKQRNYVPNGTVALRKAYNKFGMPGLDFLPKSDLDTNIAASSGASTNTTSGTQSAAGDGTENGAVSASPTQNDAEFLSPVTVGGQTLVMNFDSGSSDMWVFSTQLAASSQKGHTIYDPTKSTTFKEMPGAQFNISYGDGSFSEGPVGTDTVDIGGATVAAQAIGLPVTVAPSFVSDVTSNGLVGLAFSKLNTIRPTQQKTFFDNLLEDLSLPVFTANLKHGVAGGYEFGNIDSTQFQGSLTGVPVDNSRGFWEFESTAFSIGSGPTMMVQGGTGTAIADTGTSLMLVDDAVVQAYYSQVAGSELNSQMGGVIFPCDSTMPDLKVAIGPSYMATISGQLMNFAQAGLDTATGKQICFGGLQSNQGAGLQIYGDVFFKAQFVAFDASGPQLGLAPHA